MKILLNLLGATLVSAPVASSTINFVNNYQSQVVITKNFNEGKTQRVDAGSSITGPFDDNKEIYSSSWTIDFDDENVSYRGLYVLFSIEGSRVDINDQNLIPDKTWITISHTDMSIPSKVGVWQEEQIGGALSGVNADYVEANYFLNYFYDIDRNDVTFFVTMKSHAHNGGNTSANTAGKGTNYLYFKNAQIYFQN